MPAPHRAVSSTSRSAVWVAASVSTIFTIADLKTSLVQTQKAPQGIRSNSKALSHWWVPQLCSCRLRYVFVYSFPLGDVQLLDLPFILSLNFLSRHWSCNDGREPWIYTLMWTGIHFSLQGLHCLWRSRRSPQGFSSFLTKIRLSFCFLSRNQ